MCNEGIFGGEGGGGLALASLSFPPSQSSLAAPRSCCGVGWPYHLVLLLVLPIIKRLIVLPIVQGPLVLPLVKGPLLLQGYRGL